MFPLAILSQSIRAHQSAGRFGVEVLGVWFPTRTTAEREMIRLIPVRQLTSLGSLPDFMEQTAPAPVTRVALRDHAVVLRTVGEFFSTDELVVSEVRTPQDQWVIELMITHVENQDGEAAPRDLYLVLCIEAGARPLRSLELHFSARQRDFRGNETPFAAPAPMQHIEVAD